jgi:hypothetical protein
MRTEPIDINGLAGPAVIDVNTLTGKHSVTVGGRPAEGTRRGAYRLPTADGQTVEAKLRTGLFEPYPSLEIAGVRHRTGPPVPILLRILALLPAGLVIAGLLGGAIGGAGIVVNMGIVRSSRSNASKAALMVAVLVVAVVAVIILAAAIRSAVAGTGT